MNTVQPSRRRFLVPAAAVAALPFVAPMLVGRAEAQALTPLPADHATAKALAYTVEASAV